MGERCRATGDRRIERGATAVEYALLVSLIFVVIAAAVAILGGDVTGLFERVPDF